MLDCRPANPRCTKSAAYPDNSWLPTALADGLPEKTVGYICLHFSSWYSFLSPKKSLLVFVLLLMWWANRDTKKVPFSCRNSAGKRDEEDNFSVVPLFLGAKSAPALSHLCNNVLLCNGRIPSMLTLPMSSSALRLREEVSCFSSTVSHQPTALCNERTASFFPSTPFSWYGQQIKFRCLFFILSNFSGFVKCFFDFPSFFSVRSNF